MGTPLHALSDATFSGLVRLDFLQMADNQLATLSPDAFSGLPRLRYLGLSNNKLTALPEGLFQQLPALELLGLNANRFAALSPNVFSGLTGLQALGLSQNRLAELPPSIFSSLSSLKNLGLSHNLLTELPDSIFVGLHSLTQLNLGWNPGAPFPLALRVRRIDQERLWAPGPAVIRLEVDKGAPFAMAVPLEAAGGSLSADTALISAGTAASMDVTVTRGHNSRVQTIVSAHLPQMPDAVQGIQVAQPNPIGLFTPTRRAAAFSSATAAAAEGETVELTVEMVPPPDSALNVLYTIASEDNTTTANADQDDYTDPQSGIAAFNAGDSLAVIQIPILDDDDIEPARETFVVALAAPGEASGYALGHITSANVVIREGVCDRTPQVREALTGALLDCSSPDVQYLSSVRGLNLDPTASLSVPKPPGDNATPIESLQSRNCDDALAAADTLRPIHTRPVFRCANHDTDFVGRFSAAQSSNSDSKSFDMEPITELRERDFFGLTALRNLRLRRNRLSTLPENVFSGLDSLEQLILSGNQLTDLPDALFGPLENLEWLDLASNSLGEIGREPFSHLPNLRYLSLYGNGLDRVAADAFSDLSDLESLSLRNNSLSSLPRGVFDGLHGLQTLNLGENQLTDLPLGVFGGLDQVTTLFLHENRLRRLADDVFVDLVSLELLTVGDNEIDSLTDGVFANLVKLRGIWMYRNNLTALPGGLLANQNELVALWLYSNPLTRIPPGIFDTSTKLEILGLFDNRLESLPAAPFSTLENLRVLRLEDNRVTDLGEEAFMGLSGLQELDLRGNRLTALPPNLFVGLSSLNSLEVTGNPGSPFTMVLGAERADGKDPNSPGPAPVVVVLPQGAPYGMRIPIAAQNGKLASQEVILEAGTARGPEVVVTPGTEGSTQVSVGPPPVPPSSFRGIHLQAADPLVLFGPASNRSPVGDREIPAVRVQVGRSEFSFTASRYMRDPDGDTLEYTVVSADPSVAAATVSEDRVTVRPVASGRTRLTLKATDPGELSAESSFTVTVRAPSPGAFDIDLLLSGPLTESQEEAFLRASEYWMRILRDGDNTDIELGEDFELGCGDLKAHQRIGTLDDLVIVATIRNTDEDFLARAGICGIHEDRPFMGTIEINANWMEWMEQNGHLEGTMVHEIGHVLGIGTMWRRAGLLRNPSAAADTLVDTHFAGKLAIAAFDDAGGTSYDGAKVPVQRRRLGTAGDSHWRESVLGNELLTPVLDNGTANPLSAITIHSLADLGYTVDAKLAQAYRLPSALAQVAGGVAPRADLSEDILIGPVMIVDRYGRIIGMIPH